MKQGIENTNKYIGREFQKDTKNIVSHNNNRKEDTKKSRRKKEEEKVFGARNMLYYQNSV